MNENYVYVVKLFGSRPEPKNKNGRRGYRINVGVASTIDAAKKIGEDYLNNDPEIKKLLAQEDKFEDDRLGGNIVPLVVYEKFYGINRAKIKTPEQWHIGYEVQQFELQ